MPQARDARGRFVSGSGSGGKSSQGKGWRLIWRGAQVVADAEQCLAEGWTQVGLAAEAAAKKELYKGHGVETGTLRRSIHLAQPGYSWAGDNVKPESGTPERGKQAVAPKKQNGKLTLLLGSGMEYAAAIEFGFTSAIEYSMLGIRNFEGYRYLRNGLDAVRPKIMDILRAYFQKKFKRRTK